jgi:hypothetical protein
MRFGRWMFSQTRKLEEQAGKKTYSITSFFYPFQCFLKLARAIGDGVISKFSWSSTQRCSKKI